VADLPNLTVQLLRRGYSDEDIRKVLGANTLRVLAAAEQTAVRLQDERDPSRDAKKLRRLTPSAAAGP
jgi:membrane dipeptidase